MEFASKRFYLAVWRSEKDLCVRDAAKRFAAFMAGEAGTGFDESVHRFYSDLTRRFPDIDMMTDEEMDASPWACGLDVTGNHVIMALLHDRYAEVFPLILHLADVHDLVCFDPQNANVHLPALKRMAAA